MNKKLYICNKAGTKRCPKIEGPGRRPCSHMVPHVCEYGNKNAKCNDMKDEIFKVKCIPYKPERKQK